MKHNHLNKSAVKILKVAIKIGLSAGIFLSSIPALSAIPYRTAFEEYEMINSETKELNLSLLANVQIMVEQHRFNLGNYIPLNISANEDGRSISRKIFKQTLRTLTSDEQTANAPFISAASKINNSFSTEIKTQSNQVSFRFKPLETEAQVVYKGTVDATLAYDVSQNEAKLEVSKKVGIQTYAFTHTNNASGIVNQVGVSWNF